MREGGRRSTERSKSVNSEMGDRGREWEEVGGGGRLQVGGRGEEVG